MRHKTVPRLETRVLIVRADAQDPEEWVDVGRMAPRLKRKPFAAFDDQQTAPHYIPEPGVELDEYDLKCVLAAMKGLDQ